MLNTNERSVTTTASSVELEICKEVQLKSAIQQGIVDLVAGRVFSSNDVVERLSNRIVNNQPPT